MIVSLVGANTFLIGRERNQTVERFVAEHGDFGLEKLDGEDVSFDRMREALQSLPFLASKKLVVLRNPSAQKQFQEEFETLLGTIPDETDVLIIESKVDKRTVYFKQLKKHTAMKEFGIPDAGQLAEWVVSETRERGGTIGRSEASYLVERVGLNQQFLDNELNKLLDYETTITKQSIDLMTERTPQSTVFEMVDAALSGNTRRALELYQEQRDQRVEPQAMIGLLAWQLHALALVQSVGTRDTNQIASLTKLNPFVVRKNMSVAAKFGRAGIKRLVRELLLIDNRLKQSSIDADEALKTFIVTSLADTA